MVAGDEGARDVVGDEEAADRQPVRQSLREREELRPGAEPLPGEKRAGAADAGLHLVEAEERAMPLRQGGSDGDELGFERNHTALSEYRLEEDQPDLAARSGGGQRRDVVRGCEVDVAE